MLYRVEALASTGVLVLRAWVETGPAGGLRVRILTEESARNADRDSTVCASVDQAVEIVRLWLEEFLLAQGDARTD
jgi:hypothetical protein